jgi:hypothetical protein
VVTAAVHYRSLVRIRDVAVLPGDTIGTREVERAVSIKELTPMRLLHEVPITFVENPFGSGYDVADVVADPGLDSFTELLASRVFIV